MTISPVQAYSAQAIQAATPVKPVEETPTPAVNKDSAVISERAKDLAAQLSGKMQQEEAKEPPAVEQREQEQAPPPDPTKPTSIAEG